MKNNRLTILGLLVVGIMLIAACAPAAKEAASDREKAVYVIGGTLGDKSFIDSANRGLTRAMEDFPVDYVPVEASADPAKLETAFVDTVADPDTDWIIVGSWDLQTLLMQTAAENLDKKFVLFDIPILDEECVDGCPNVYAMTYKQNEGSYLAGLYAGLMSESKVIGAVGGYDIPVINDFMVGYTQGAVDAGLTKENVLIQYAASWVDPAKGKELANTMYTQGADIVFQVAGGTGEGVFFAAEEAGKWAIGVDSDQALIIEETNPEQAERILTSMMKNVDNSMYRMFELYFAGELPFGTSDSLGIAEGGVGLAYNKYYDEKTPQEVKDKIEEAQKKVLSGEIVVETVF